MLKSIFNYFLAYLILIFFQFSCANKKKLIYFQNNTEVKTDSINRYNSILKTDDLLSISVMASNIETVRPFNLSSYGQSQSGTNQNNSNLAGYLINTNGEIEFPVIGKIKIAGLKRSEASDLIIEKLKPYLSDPMVNIQILNFKITILGDVARPGTYSIPNERVSLIELIGMAGDLNITGKRQNILLIRDVDGRKIQTRIDLTKTDFFNSPYFYLQQNDVVYVEQNRAKKNSSALNTASIGVIVSITSLVVTLITLISRN